jgi:hypothetical protein
MPDPLSNTMTPTESALRGEATELLYRMESREYTATPKDQIDALVAFARRERLRGRIEQIISDMRVVVERKQHHADTYRHLVGKLDQLRAEWNALEKGEEVAGQM